MRRSLLEKLACPYDNHELTLQEFKKDKHDNITEGLFSCSRCHRFYPIVYGIPIFTPDEYREAALEKPLLERWGLTLQNPETFKKLPVPLKEE